MKLSKTIAWEGAIMKRNRHRWTIIVVSVWVLALVFTSALVPTPAEAKTSTYGAGWMVYTPNHPNGCAPMPYDCYVLMVYPD
jgi:hypothetical protein